jgi:murein DD-endopeptidase MepM/ murein hydrolase activator NlpD
MADEKKDIHFIIVPQNGARTYTVRLRRGLIYLIGALLILFILLFGYMAVVHQSLLSKALRASRLEKENDILRTQALKISELEGELVRLNAIRQHIYELAGVTSEAGYGERGAMLANESLSLPFREDASASYSAPTRLFATNAILDTTRTEVSSIPSLWPVRGWVTAEFGEVLPGRERRHQGLDIAASQGTPILAAASGRVTFSGWDKDLGMVVIVDHENGLGTLYGHCSRILVEMGDNVSQGQVIAHLGNTGRSSAPHLHFEVRENGAPVGPRSYLGP